MFRAVPRLIARPALRAAPMPSFAPARRYISTAPPTQKSRSWKSLVARVGAAGAIIYYYNTTDVFAEEPRHPAQALPEIEAESEHLPTIESISEERQRRKAVQAQLDAQKQKQQEEAAKAQQDEAASGAEGGLEGLEEEAGQQGAFNPETGEINWDCPCLGGMADGPCGPQFKEAFSCFVYSQEEPKGMDCIDKFKNMQNCFREYPEIYGSELDSDADDEDDMSADLPTPSDDSATSPASSSSSVSASAGAPTPSSQKSDHATSAKAKQSGEPSSKPREPIEVASKLDLVPESYKPEAKKEELIGENESVVPKAAFDTRGANAEGFGEKVEIGDIADERRDFTRDEMRQASSH